MATTGGGSDGGQVVDGGGSGDLGSTTADGGGSDTADLADGTGSADGGNDPIPGGTLPVGCGCSLTPTAVTPGLLALLPALALLLRCRRRAQAR